MTAETDSGRGSEPVGGHIPPDPGPTNAEIVGAAGAIGGGIGASLAISSGQVTGAALVTVGAAAVAGVTASGLAGWQIGKAFYSIEFVQQHLQWALAFVANAPRGDDPFGAFLRAPQFPDETWHFDYGPSPTPVDQWWYVASPGDVIANAEQMQVYSDPFLAMAAAGVVNENGVIGANGTNVSALYMVP